nr:MAG TPA: hypothetical protein [Caudoviricetes sp.]
MSIPKHCSCWMTTTINRSPLRKAPQEAINLLMTNVSG